MSTETQKTKPEAVALLLGYLAARANKRLGEENGCTVKSEHCGYTLWVEGVHMATIPNKDPKERDVLLAYRILGLEDWRSAPIDLAVKRCKSATDLFRGKVGAAEQKRSEVIDLIRELQEWTSLLRITLMATGSAADPE